MFAVAVAGLGLLSVPRSPVLGVSGGPNRETGPDGTTDFDPASHWTRAIFSLDEGEGSKGQANKRFYTFEHQPENQEFREFSTGGRENVRI